MGVPNSSRVLSERLSYYGNEDSDGVDRADGVDGTCWRGGLCFKRLDCGGSSLLEPSESGHPESHDQLSSL
ncbi:hypothetical protein P3T76_016043 [Phytophthora citrophthora]|uniref:Uncharacterized protein n=1 Tax=Phytophthora citrophthora TaxID=4793 RepID=A0AAD9L9S6_9STRA|nr:hypothetical protein P3T76_016043 [Phytophthora citrophthora]